MQGERIAISLNSFYVNAFNIKSVVSGGNLAPLGFMHRYRMLGELLTI